MIAYHDEEWGLPVASDKELWAKLMLDSFQAGLSWRVILEKRDNFLSAFDRFDPDIVAEYGDDEVNALMQNRGIVRNQSKIRATIGNARAYRELTGREGGFRRWLMRFVDDRPRIDGSCPPTSPEAEAMAAALKEAGFRFTGPRVCYAFMQATGFVMDHAPGCFRAAHCAALLREEGRRRPWLKAGGSAGCIPE